VTGARSFDAARTVGGSGQSGVDGSLAELLARGECSRAPESCDDDDDRCGSHLSREAPAAKGPCTQNDWSRTSGAGRAGIGVAEGEPTIRSASCESHVMVGASSTARLEMRTAYFTAKSDLSTLFDDLALVRQPH